MNYFKQILHMLGDYLIVGNPYYNDEIFIKKSIYIMTIFAFNAIIRVKGENSQLLNF